MPDYVTGNDWWNQLPTVGQEAEWNYPQTQKLTLPTGSQVFDWLGDLLDIGQSQGYPGGYKPGPTPVVPPQVQTRPLISGMMTNKPNINRPIPGASYLQSKPYPQQTVNVSEQRKKMEQNKQALGWAQMRQQMQTATGTTPKPQMANAKNIPLSQQMQGYGWSVQRWAQEHPGQPFPKQYSNPLVRAQEEASVKAQYSQGYAALSAYLNLLGTKPQEQPQTQNQNGYGYSGWGYGSRYKQRRWAEALPGVVWRMNQ